MFSFSVCYFSVILTLSLLSLFSKSLALIQLGNIASQSRLITFWAGSRSFVRCFLYAFFRLKERKKNNSLLCFYLNAFVCARALYVDRLVLCFIFYFYFMHCIPNTVHIVAFPSFSAPFCTYKLLNCLWLFQKEKKRNIKCTSTKKGEREKSFVCLQHYGRHLNTMDACVCVYNRKLHRKPWTILRGHFNSVDRSAVIFDLKRERETEEKRKAHRHWRFSGVECVRVSGAWKTVKILKFTLKICSSALKRWFPPAKEGIEAFHFAL